MLEKSTVAIAPEAALRAVTAENEWRRNRILVLEMRLLEAEAALRAAAEEAAVAASEAKPKAVKAVTTTKPESK